MPSQQKSEWDKAVDIVRDAGGKIVGRTRFQKIAYLLELAGLGEGFAFEYRHYGPYSEGLTAAASLACFADELREEEKKAEWGGTYSIFTAASKATGAPATRVALAEFAAKADAIELELAATAAFLASKGASEPWEETARRKPEKAADDRIKKARDLYKTLRELSGSSKLPQID